MNISEHSCSWIRLSPVHQKHENREKGIDSGVKEHDISWLHCLHALLCWHSAHSLCIFTCTPSETNTLYCISNKVDSDLKYKLYQNLFILKMRECLLWMNSVCILLTNVYRPAVLYFSKGKLPWFEWILSCAEHTWNAHFLEVALDKVGENPNQHEN